MNPTKETKWLCENSRALEKFSGKLVMFSVMKGVLYEGASLDSMMRANKKIKLHNKPFVFHVPSKSELDSPVPIIRSDQKQV